MAIALFVTTAIGGALLLAAAVLLCVLNWNEKILGTLASILLGGIVTAIIAVSSTLKETRIDRGFATSVVFDQGLPAFLPFDPSAPKMSMRLSTLSSLGRPVVMKDGNATLTVQPADTDDATFQFGAELLQYQVVHELERIQRRGWSIQQLGAAVTPAVRVPAHLTRMRTLTRDAVSQAITSNRFSNSDMERFRVEHSRIPLPEGTRLKLFHQPSSPQTGPERRSVRLENPWFFTIDISVEPMGGSGAGVVPGGLAVPPDVASRLRTFSYKFGLTAKFKLLTSGNWRIEEHRRWTEWLFEELQGALAD